MVEIAGRAAVLGGGSSAQDLFDVAHRDSSRAEAAEGFERCDGDAVVARVMVGVAVVDAEEGADDGVVVEAGLVSGGGVCVVRMEAEEAGDVGGQAERLVEVLQQARLRFQGVSRQRLAL